MPALKQQITLKNGDKLDLYYIGTLAHALGRTSGLIRKWEVGGIIPTTGFKDKSGRRLYTQEQIDIIVKCAERAKIKQGLCIGNTNFSKWCHKELEALKQKYKGEMN